MNDRRAKRGCRGVLGSLLALAFVSLLSAPVAVGNSWQFIGARYQANGGTGVGYADDSAAAYWNPANLAFDKGWDVQLPATLNASIENRALEKLSGMVVSFDNLGSDLQSIFDCVPSCPSSPPDILGQGKVANLLTRFSQYGRQGEAALVGIDIGLMGRYNNFGFTIISQTTGTIYPNTDLGNLGIPISVATLISNASLSPSNLGSGLADMMVAASQGGGDPWTKAQADHLVALVEREGGNPTDPNLQTLLTGLAANTGLALGSPNLFSSNNTGALAAGLSLQEFAFTYSHLFKVPGYRQLSPRTRSVLRYVHKRLSVGITPKYMLGISFFKFFGYDDGKGADDILKSLSDFDNSTIDHNFGLDLGLSWRPWDFLQLGFTFRNVNQPNFEFKFDPQIAQLLLIPKYQALAGYSFELPVKIRMGVSFTPIRNLVLAIDADLTENPILSLPDFASRYLSLGAEYTIPMGRHFALALRLGGYNNLAGEVEQDWAMTGGLGLRIGGFVLDASAGGSFEKEIIRTGDYTYSKLPTRINAGLTLKWEHSL